MRKNDFTDEELQKLPKWARDKASALTVLLNRAENALAVHAGEVETDVYMHDGLNEKPLPSGRIRFYVGDKTAGGKRRNAVDCNVDTKGVLTVYGSRTLHIIPMASNSFHLKVED